MEGLRYATINANGIRESPKRHTILQWLSNLRPHFTCLQETHILSCAEATFCPPYFTSLQWRFWQLISEPTHTLRAWSCPGSLGLYPYCHYTLTIHQRRYRSQLTGQPPKSKFWEFLLEMLVWKRRTGCLGLRQSRIALSLKGTGL